MPTWILLALGAAALSAMVNVIDKTVLVKWMKRPDGSLVPFAVLELAAGLIVLAILGFPRMATPDLAAALLAGAAFGLAAVCYFRALKAGEVTRLIPFYDFIPLITLLFATVFLGEILTARHYVAVGLIVAGALALSVRDFRVFRPAPGTGWMLATIACTAVGAILSKYALGSADPWTVFGWGRVGSSAVILPFLPSAYEVFSAAVKRSGWRVIAATSASEVLTVTYILLFTLASSGGPVSLVSALAGTHPIYLLIFAAVLSRIRPELLKEERSAASFFRKAMGTVMVVAGAALIS